MPKTEVRKSQPAAKAGARSVAGASKPAAKTVRTRAATVTAPPDLEERIGQRAYELWESEGRPDSRDQAHWQQAEMEITKARRGRGATA